MVSDVPLHAALTHAGADQLAERWRPSAARATRASWAPSSGEGVTYCIYADVGLELTSYCMTSKS